MRHILLLTLLTLLLAGCEPAPSAPAMARNGRGPNPLRLALPDGEARVTLTQRATEPLPGSEGQVRLTIDDITRGQVMVSVATYEGQAVLSPVSLRPGESARFTLDDQTYTLTLEALDNQLIGEDTARFLVRETAPSTTGEASPHLTEQEKIERLIQTVAELEGATFIRNNTEHTAAEAAEHMRSKWLWKGDNIQTAEAFIEQAASHSSVTGSPYLIRWSDGTEMESAAFLRRELERMAQPLSPQDTEGSDANHGG